MELSRRLRAAAELVRPGCLAVDVGCDHGLLSAALILSGTCRAVTACDINPGPLAGAKALFESLGITDRARALLGDGLHPVSPEDADDIIIAGMGGDLILRILDKAPWVKDPEKRLILLPATRDPVVRAGLCARGFRILSETPIFERGHCYSVMHAAYTGEVTEPDALRRTVGEIRACCPDGREYLKKSLRRCDKIATGAAVRDPERAKEAASLAAKISALLEEQEKTNAE